MKYRSLEEDLDEALKDTGEAVLYLNAVLEEGDPDALLMALAHIARARGVTNIAQKSGLGREAIYKMLREHANPEFRNIVKILEASGLRLVIKKAPHPIREKVAA